MHSIINTEFTNSDHFYLTQQCTTRIDGDMYNVFLTFYTVSD